MPGDDRRDRRHPTGPEDPAAAQPSLAEKIDRLFRTVHPADRGEFTYREVEDGIRAIMAERGEQDVSLSASYICQLRKGRRINPRLRQVEALAAFFKIPVTYFVGTPGEVEAIDAQMSLVRALRDHEVRDIALRLTSLNTAGVRAVADMVTSLQAVPELTRRRPPRRPEPQGPSDVGPGTRADDGPAAGAP